MPPIRTVISGAVKPKSWDWSTISSSGLDLDFPLNQFLNASAAGSRFENEFTSVISCEASPLPFLNGIVKLNPAAKAASSIAELPAKIIVSAKLIPDSEEIVFKTERVFESLSGSFASQSFWGDKDILAPFAPPLRSEFLKDFALSQAADTRSEIDSPELEILLLMLSSL